MPPTTPIEVVIEAVKGTKLVICVKINPSLTNFPVLQIVA
jgi:hypothetical protein